MIPTRRLLAGAALAAVCILVAAGCDTSPVAASVSSHEIKQTALNAELRAVASNGAFVSAYDGEQANQTAGLAVVGDAKGTYNARFVANILTEVIQSSILHQYLAAHHHLPSAGVIAAVGGFDAASYRAIWLGFPAAYREELVQRDAELSEFVPYSQDSASLRSAISTTAAYLYSRVCVRSIGVSVDGADGQVNYPASLVKAKGLISQNHADHTYAAILGRSSIGGGVVSCYTPDQLASQGTSYYETVLGLGVGQVTAPIRTSFGYQLYVVTERTDLPVNSALVQAASLALARQNGLDDPTLQKVLASKHVHVNPQYGTWSTKELSVIPPSTLGANATQSSGSTGG